MTSASGEQRRISRNCGLDILRLIAVVLVLFHHNPVCPRDLAAPVRAAADFLQRGGWIGVDIFFVLSGYLVSGLIFSEHRARGRFGAGRFLIRRGFKIYPPFWVLVFTTIAVRTLSGQRPPLSEPIADLLFIQNYVYGLWGHCWSLAVEEHFYLALAALMVFLLRPARDPRAVPGIFLATALLCLASRVLAAWRDPDYTDIRFLWPTHMRIDSLFFGVLISYCRRYRPDMRIFRAAAPALILSGGLLLLPPFLWYRSRHLWLTVFWVIPLYLGSGLLLVAAIRLQSPASAALRFLARLGAGSYSVYLWHMPFRDWVVPALQDATGLRSWPLFVSFYIPGAIAFGMLMARAIEDPMLRLRDRWKFSSARTVRPESYS